MKSLHTATRKGELAEGDEVIYRHWSWWVTGIKRTPMNNGTDISLYRTDGGERTVVTFADAGPFDAAVLRALAEEGTA